MDEYKDKEKKMEEEIEMEPSKNDVRNIDYLVSKYMSKGFSRETAESIVRNYSELGIEIPVMDKESLEVVTFTEQAVNSMKEIAIKIEKLVEMPEKILEEKHYLSVMSPLDRQAYNFLKMVGIKTDGLKNKYKEQAKVVASGELYKSMKNTFENVKKSYEFFSNRLIELEEEEIGIKTDINNLTNEANVIGQTYRSNQQSIDKLTEQIEEALLKRETTKIGKLKSEIKRLRQDNLKIKKQLMDIKSKKYRKINEAKLLKAKRVIYTKLSNYMENIYTVTSQRIGEIDSLKDLEELKQYLSKDYDFKAIMDTSNNFRKQIQELLSIEIPTMPTIYEQPFAMDIEEVEDTGIDALLRDINNMSID